MAEGDSANPVRSLEVSISFGRFENDLLSWEKWSSFSQNKYLEEVEKCATPGSVKEKKAYFEARNKLIAVRKAELLNKQMEACRELSEENEIQDSCGSEVNQYDEEVIEENLFGSDASSPDMGEHPELETNTVVGKEQGEIDIIKDISAKQFTTDEVEGIFPMSEASFPLVIENQNTDTMTLELETEMLNKDNPDENTHERNSDLNEYNGQMVTGTVQEEPILKSELSGCGTDQPFGVQTFVLGSAQTNGENQVEHHSEMGSKVDVNIDTPEEVKDEAILKSELRPNMLDQLKVDDACPDKSSSPTQGENVKSKNAEEIPALETEKIAVEAECDQQLSNTSASKSAPTQKIKPNPQKSTKKTFPANKQNGRESAKKTPVSSVPRSPQTPIISKPSTPTVKSALQPLPMSRVKKAAASAVPKSPQVPATSRSTTPSLKPSLSSPSKKIADSLTSRKKSISAGVSRKPTTTSLHMSLNFGSKFSDSISGSTSVTEPRKSLFMEKMGDKDIVKRAFRAFRYMSIPLNSLSLDTNVTPKQVRDKTDAKPSTPILQKEKDRLIIKGVDERTKKPSSMSKAYNPALHSKDDKRKEAKKVTQKTEVTEHREAPKIRIQSKYKDGKESQSGDGRQSITYKATTQPGLYRGQRLSKSFQDKDASKIGIRQ
uniref:Protein WVD2-like 7 n=1 Tax=Kalanchoe fedtschenkoi TaxID=63787 RepID=A0A7N0ZXQ8_KALFE